MGVDGFTFWAQIFNFGVLMALLHRLLYRPVLAAVETREAEIRARLDDARTAREEAAAEARAYQDRVREVEGARDEVLRGAQRDAAALRERLEEEAREDVERAREEWRRSLRRERDEFLGELTESVARQVCRTAARALSDLADHDLEARIVSVFLRRLGELAGEGRERLRSAVVEGEEVRVRAASPVDEGERRELVAALGEILGTEPHAAPPVMWEVDPTLVAGLELRAGDWKLSWSVGAWVDELEADAAERLQEETVG